MTFADLQFVCLLSFTDAPEDDQAIWVGVISSLVQVAWNFRHWSVSKIDHITQVPAVLAVGVGRFFLPLYWSLFFGRKYWEKIAQHMQRAIAILHFPICAQKVVPHLLHLQQRRVTISPYTPYNLTRYGDSFVQFSF